MSIIDFFKPAPVATPDTSTAALSVNKEGQDNKAASTTAKEPAKVDPNNLTKDSENPFDTYQKVFDNAAKNSDIQAPSFSLDPKVIAEVSTKLDFTQGINPELVQKAKEGDVPSLMQLIQESNRNAYRAALEHSTKLTDTHLGQRSEFESKRVQKGVKEQMTSDALSANNPNLNHPVIKAELNRIARQFAASPEYRDASPSEIARAAHKYLSDIHAAMNPADPTKTKEGKAKPTEIDYVSYFTGTSNG